MNHIKQTLMICMAVAAVAACNACGGDVKPPEATKVTTTIPTQRVVIGRVPSGSPVDIVEKMEPLITMMNKELGLDANLRFGKDYADLTKRMETHEFDLAFCGPFQYVGAHEKTGYEAILRPVRHGSDTYIGLIITAKPEITTVEQLKGKNIAFVDPVSAGGYLLQLGFMISKGLSPDDIHGTFLMGHDNVVLNVLNKTYDAGACFDGAVKAYAKTHADEIRVIGRTDAIFNEPIAISPKFRSEHRELADKIVAFMVNVNKTQAGRDAIAKLGDGITEYVVATDSDYTSVRAYRAKLPAKVIEAGGL